MAIFALNFAKFEKFQHTKILIFFETIRNFAKLNETLLSETYRNFNEISRNLPKLTEISRNRFRVSVQTLIVYRILNYVDLEYFVHSL